MRVSIVVAVSENGVIGRDNQLLWRLPDDLKRFKALTLGHPIVMGRKTYESIGRPLPGRTSIVLTRSDLPFPEGVVRAGSLPEALSRAEELGQGEAFLIGGGDIYQQALTSTQIDCIYLTLVHTQVEGDAFFSIPNEKDWQVRARSFHPADERHAFAFEFLELIPNVPD